MKKIFIFVACCMSPCLAVIPPEAKNRDVRTAFMWGTHQAPLVTAVLKTTGPVLELGAGDFSTTILHAICESQNRLLWSVETSENWLSYFLDLETELHTFIYTADTVQLAKEAVIHWSVVFIDQHPNAQRKLSLLALRDKTDVFVLHDAEKKYYDDIPSMFKYQYLYDRYKVQTWVLSDTIDVREWFQ
jgi:hypothetical protein